MHSKYQTGSFELMKTMNRSLILNTIREKGPVSRAEIAKLTELTPPTVSNVVKQLLASGIVIETTQGESNGGRKPTMLIINAQNFYVVGLDVGPKVIRFALTDLNGSIMHHLELSIDVGVHNHGLLELMKRGIQTLITKISPEREKMIGIGIGMHGIVDVDQGMSKFAPNLNLRDIPIKATLEETFGVVVKVENDARVMALGEVWFGQGQNYRHVMTVNVGHGIGAGLTINGELYHGHSFLAGEIGHMSIDLSGPKCPCGSYGCLQTFASGPAIAERVKKELASGQASSINEHIDHLDQINGKMVYDAAQEGDELCLNILQQTGRYLGIGLTNLIHVINPEYIILTGGVAKAGDILLDPIKATIAERGITSAAKQTKVAVSKLGDHSAAVGAVTLILTELFSSDSSHISA
ncbi:ROK family transcriptional regulator [Tuberibacillus sp. Marseille-P3662]|uniref:ROK family transcriptional regulator n=1 Tax=Tuberibacillus sp. Marseille-P3662 TaxID=1965358 RepID=UPI000A1CBCF0|nr:ROK family transcriptional regulator [Tuberibacillus sp. Marseille-P3662]